MMQKSETKIESIYRKEIGKKDIKEYDCLSYCCGVDGVRDKRHIIFNRKSSAENGFVKFSKVETGIDVETLIWQQTFVQRRKVLGRGILQTTVFTAKQESTTEKLLKLSNVA